METRISQALADLREPLDVSAEDLEILLERAEHYATLHAGPSVKGANPIRDFGYGVVPSNGWPDRFNR